MNAVYVTARGPSFRARDQNVVRTRATWQQTFTIVFNPDTAILRKDRG